MNNKHDNNFNIIYDLSGKKLVQHQLYPDVCVNIVENKWNAKNWS